MNATSWWAEGLLFENCNCQLVCPGHVSFKQLCTHDRCLGLWGIHFQKGEYGGTSLASLDAAIAWNSPQHMIAGGWTIALYLDERASDRQLEGIESILSGGAGGPWQVLARFVGKRLASQVVPIQFEDAARKKRMWVDGVFDTSIEAIRGRNKAEEVTLSNMFNQIHSPVQVLALGETRCTDRRMPFSTDGTHGLYSRFAWRGP